MQIWLYERVPHSKQFQIKDMSVLFVRAFAKYLTREHLTDCYEISLTV